MKTALIYPLISTHQPTAMGKTGFADYDMSDSEMDCQNDIEDMCRIATLAEHFGLTSFHTYQKEVVNECLNGRDTIVVQPTGSGKSLCYQFPAVYTGKMSIVISPTISLMVDQVEKLTRPWDITYFVEIQISQCCL